MTAQDLYVSRPKTEAFLKGIEDALQNPAGSALLFHLWGIGGVGKTTLLRKVQEMSSESANVLVSYSHTEGIETPIKLMKLMHDRLSEHFKLPPILKRDVREVLPKSDPFITLYEKYFDTIHQLKEEVLNDKETSGHDQFELIESLIEHGTSAVRWGAIATGNLGVAGVASSVGAAADKVTDKARAVLSLKNQFEQLLRKNAATKKKRELQELILEPIPKLTKAFLETLKQWSVKKPILLLLDTYELAPDAVDNWLCRNLIGNALHLQKCPIRLVIAGRYQLTKNERWQRIQQDYQNIQEEKLVCFGQEETEQYLKKFGVTSVGQVKSIHSRTSGLPYYLNKVREKYNGNASPLEFLDVEDIADFLLGGLGVFERRVVQGISCAHWFDRDLVENLVVSLDQPTENHIDWYEWLKQQHFVDRVRNRYQIQDVARKLFRNKLYQENKRGLREFHNQLSTFYECKMLVGFENEKNPISLYSDRDWREAAIEFVYHVLFSERADARIQFLTHLFTGQYLERGGVAEIPLRRILVEEQLSANSCLSSRIQDFLSLIVALVVPFRIVETNTAVVFQVLNAEEALKESLKYIDQLQGVARFYAYLCKSQICVSDQRVAWLKKAMDVAFTLSDVSETVFSSKLFQDLSGNFLILKEYEEALKCAKCSTQFDPESLRAWFIQAEVLSALACYEEAVSSFDKANELDSCHAICWHNRGLDLSELERYEEAIASIDRSVELMPGDANFWSNRGRILLSSGKTDEALSSFEKSVECAPESALAQHNYSAALKDIGKLEEALIRADKALAYQSSDMQRYMSLCNRGEILSALERFQEAVEAFDKALEYKYDFLPVLNNRGLDLAKIGKYAEAISSFDQAIEVDPKDAVAWTNRGSLLDDLERYEEAISDFDRAIQLYPENHIAWNNRGNSLTDLEQKEAAILSYNKAIQIAPQKSLYWYCRGNAFSEFGEPENAISDYRKAIEIDSENFDAWCRLALELSLAGDISKELVRLEQLVTKLNYLEAWYHLGKIQSKLGYYEQAAWSHKKALNINSKRSDIWNDLAHTYCFLGRWNEMLESSERAIEIDSNFAGAIYNRGVALYQLDFLQEALRCFEQAIHIQSNYYEAWFNKSLMLSLLKRDDEAFESYCSAAQIRLDDYELWLNRGQLLFKLGRHHAALQDYETALRLKPDSYKALFAKGVVSSALNLFKEAVHVYAHMVGLRPNDVDVLVLHGAALLKLGEYQQAIQSFERVLNIQPKHYQATFQIGQILSELEEHDKAIVYYESILDNHPEDYEIWDAKGRALSRLGRYDESLQSFNQVLQIKPLDCQALCAKASLLSQMERYDDALCTFNQVLELNQDLCEVWYNRAILLLKLGQYHQAVQSCDRALEIDSRSVSALHLKQTLNSSNPAEVVKQAKHAVEDESDYRVQLARGISLSNAGYHTQAIRICNRVLKDNPECFEILLAKSLMLYNANQNEALLRNCDAMLSVNHPYAKLAWYYKGLALRRLERFEDSLFSFDQAVEIVEVDPNYWYIWSERGLLLSEELGCHDEALQSYDCGLQIAIDSSEKDNVALAILWLNRSLALLNLDKLDEALEGFDCAIALDFRYVKAWLMKGNTLYAMDSYEEAISCYDRALELKTDCYEALCNKGNALLALEQNVGAVENYQAVLEGKPELYPQIWWEHLTSLAALNRYEEIVSICNIFLNLPNDGGFVWNQRGTALCELERYEDAHASFDRAIELQPEQAIHYYHKACCYVRQRLQLELAIQNLKVAIDLSPEYKAIARSDEELELLRDDEQFKFLVLD